MKNIADLKNILDTTNNLMLLVFCHEKDMDEYVITNLEKTNKDMRIIRGHRCLTKDKLLQEWAAALQFPYYFGNNWDAFEECINDLEWLGADEMNIFVTQVDQIFESDEILLGTLVNILDAAQKRQTAPSSENLKSGKSFSIVFQSELIHSENLLRFFRNIGISINVLDEPGEDLGK